MVSASLVFKLVTFSLGQVGDGLNLFQGVYLVGLGWNEGAVGIALSIMGFSALLLQPIAGDIIDKVKTDRRYYLGAAALFTAGSACAIIFVKEGNQQHGLIYTSKLIEGISSSFIGPCIAAITLGSVGSSLFDAQMTSNILWGHYGSVFSAIGAGVVAYIAFPKVQYCFFFLAIGAILAIVFLPFLPQGDPLLGRGVDVSDSLKYISPYRDVITTNFITLCCCGFLFHLANANVLLVVGEIMGQADNEDGRPQRSALPLISCAIVVAQSVMAVTTTVCGTVMARGFGRKPLLLIAFACLPVRIITILLCGTGVGDFDDVYDVDDVDSSGFLNAILISTQIWDGIAGGIFGLLHPIIIADLAFGTGRFNVMAGASAACFGFGGMLSNLIGQHLVEYYDFNVSLGTSLIVSVFPILIWQIRFKETREIRGTSLAENLNSYLIHNT